MKKSQRNPKETRIACPRCGGTFTAGAPHYAFCVGQRKCDQCGKEYANGNLNLERCETCKGIFCAPEDQRKRERSCIYNHNCQPEEE